MKTTVGQRVMLLIKHLEYTQADFAKNVDVNQVTLSRIVNDEHGPSVKTITKICNAFGVNRAWLLENKGEMFVNGKPEKINPIGMQSNPYQDLLYKELRDQIDFLKETVRTLAGAKAANFLKVLTENGCSDEQLLAPAA